MRCELINHMGDDLTIVNAARVSFDKESDWVEVECTEDCENPFCDGTKLDLGIPDTKLINYLAKHNHFTPFTHCTITLRETIPIFVARQRFKHMVGFSYNEVSRRYVDDTPEFFVPDFWRSRADNKKQGSGDERIDYDKSELEHFYRDVLYLYNKLLENNVAPEMARMVLPQSMYTSYYVTGSLAAFARAYKLRIDPHAQKEIQDLAVMWDEIIRPLYPVSWSALVEG